MSDDRNSEHHCEFEHEHCHEEHDNRLHAATQEVPIVLSYEEERILTEPLTGAELSEIYKDSFAAINQWCQTERVLVGHIKLQLRVMDGACWASCTGTEINIRKTTDWDKLRVEAYNLTFAAIVFKTTQSKLKAAVTGLMPE